MHQSAYGEQPHVTSHLLGQRRTWLCPTCVFLCCINGGGCSPPSLDCIVAVRVVLLPVSTSNSGARRTRQHRRVCAVPNARQGHSTVLVMRSVWAHTLFQRCRWCPCRVVDRAVCQDVDVVTLNRDRFRLLLSSKTTAVVVAVKI